MFGRTFRRGNSAALIAPAGIARCPPAHPPPFAARCPVEQSHGFSVRIAAAYTATLFVVPVSNGQMTASIDEVNNATHKGRRAAVTKYRRIGQFDSDFIKLTPFTGNL